MPDTPERRLAAILSADVAGYSRLMGRDEVATVRTIEAYRAEIVALVAQHRGRVVDAPGDNLLAEFPSATDAMQSALAIQRAIRARNAPLEPEQRMEFRVGIHLGEVIVEGERIYGEGINIAARLEGLARPGELTISDAVYTQVAGKLALEAEDLGHQSLKNIARPVHAYRVRPGDSPSVATPPPELPDVPSIAVLPFVNMSGDPEQEYFADGITEDLITDISKISGLFVIARNSVFTYKGRAVRVDEVGRDLGVRYVLEGSVRKAGSRVRITAQLVEARTGHHLWADRYDRELEDVFAVQDEVTQSIVRALEVELTDNERTRVARPPTVSLEAYDEYLRGKSYAARVQATESAREHFLRALDLDPDFADACAELAGTYLTDWISRSADDGALERASECACRAIELDPEKPVPRSVLGSIRAFAGDHDAGVDEAERAVSLDPNSAECWSRLGTVYSLAGRSEDALSAHRRAQRLDPSGGRHHHFGIAVAYRQLGEDDQALAAFHRELNEHPDYYPALMNLAAIYGNRGELEKARTALARLKEVRGDFSWSSIPRLRFRDTATLRYIEEGLRKAGLEEE
jgi:adenylate cyclase